MAQSSLKGFSKTLHTALKDGKTDYALRLFKEEKYLEEIQNNSWDLIPVVTGHITEDNKSRNPELFKCCNHLLELIGEISNPEETVLQFISEIEEAKENAKFIALLNPLQKTISRISHKRANSLAWSFNAIQTYLRQCKIPEYDNLDGKERLLVDQTKVVSNILLLCEEVIVFYDTFINSLGNDAEKEVKAVLCKFLVQLLGSPLCYLNMASFNSFNTEAYSLAEVIVEKVIRINVDPIVLMELTCEKEHDELIRPEDLSIANFIYFVYVKKICFEFIPKVYSSEYMFNLTLHMMSTLLKENNLLLTERALDLSQYVFTLVKGHKLSYLYLNNEAHCDFCTDLCNVIVFNPFDEARKSALSVLKAYLESFEEKGIYLIIGRLFTVLSHSGLKGYLITFYKDLFNKEINLENAVIPDCFKGPKLFRMLRKFCYLSKKEETDLIDNSDQIIASLNFLRFFALWDKNNATRFWDFAPILFNMYLEPLRKGIELSKAHYELEIKNIEKDRVKKHEDAEVSVVAFGKDLPKIPKEEKLLVLNSSLTALDVMHSLLSRVTELLNNR